MYGFVDGRDSAVKERGWRLKARRVRSTQGRVEVGWKILKVGLTSFVNVNERVQGLSKFMPVLLEPHQPSSRHQRSRGSRSMSGAGTASTDVTATPRL
jgi:hypothetical protein